MRVSMEPQSITWSSMFTPSLRNMSAATSLSALMAGKSDALISSTVSPL